MSEWVNLHRKVWDHWLYEKARPLTRLEAWIKMLCEVNDKPEKVSIGNTIIDVEIGESIYSLDKWAGMFNWSKSKVRRFFQLLERDSMIETKVVLKSTHLKVCKYNYYKDERNGSETMMKRSWHDNSKKKKVEIDPGNPAGMLLTQVDETALQEPTRNYYKIAMSFYELIKSNMENINVPATNLQEAKFGNWVDPIRLLFETDKRTVEECREVFKIIKEDDFWREQVRSTAKLRRKDKDGVTYFEVLLTRARNGRSKKESAGANSAGVSDDYKREILNRLRSSGSTEEV